MTISNLIARLEAASGPDRELEAEIALQAGWQVFPGDNWIGPEGQIAVPEYTASIDPAVALAKRIANPAWIRLDEWYMGENKAAVAAILPNPTPNETYGGKGANLAIALLIATLKAKEATHDK